MMTFELDLLRHLAAARRLAGDYSVIETVRSGKADVDSVHIRQHDIDHRDAREMVKPDKIIGLSIATIAELEASKGMLTALDHIESGLAFARSSKKNAGKDIMLVGLTRAVDSGHLSVVAIGRIRNKNAQSAMPAELSEKAFVSAIMAQPDRGTLSKTNRKRVDRAKRWRH